MVSCFDFPMKVQPLHRATCAFRIAILSLLALAGLLSLPALAATPNIIVIVADDLAWHDLRVNGAPDVATPNLDWIASHGVNFRNGYVTAPICSPSRAGLMTGRYQQRFGHETNPGPRLETSEAFGLPPTEITLAERFKGLNLDYATGWIGKSHLGATASAHPNVIGFDHFLGFLQSHHDYIDANNFEKSGYDLIQRNGVNLPTNPPRDPNNPTVILPYLTYLFSQEIGAFIDTNATNNRPFFLYAPFNAVHFDLQAPLDLVQRFNTENPALAVPLPADLTMPNAILKLTEREKLKVVLFGLDEAVGKILATLRSHSRGFNRTLEDETLIFFTSDNGGDTLFGGVNAPLRDRKTTLYEGGIRVPFLMYWKNRLGPAVLDAPVSTLDILPTALAATGAAIPPNLDGVNLFPYIQNPAGQKPHDRLFWRVETNGISISEDAPDGLRAMREGDWKIVKPGPTATWELYNLLTDEAEKIDQADADPDRLRRMITAYNAWSAQMARPRWAWNVLNYADPAFILEDIRVGSPTTSYLAPDFLSSAARFAFQDAGNALRHDGFDPATGFVAQAPVLVDSGLTPLATAQLGPQWGLGGGSASLFYTKPGAGARNQVWRAIPGAVAAVTTTTAFDSFGARASRDFADGAVQFAFTAGTDAAWASVARPRTSDKIPFHAGGADNGRWIPESEDLAYAGTPAGVAVPQIVRLRTATNTHVQISNDSGAKSDVWAFRAPELGGALCYAAVVDRSAIGIYAEVPGVPGSAFQRIATLSLPAGSPAHFLHSMRPLDGLRGFNGVSYFTCIASVNADPKNPGASQVWLLGLGPDATNRVARRLDDDMGARFAPQTVVGANEVFAYYRRYNGADPAQLRRAVTGLGKPNYATAGGFPALQYEWSFEAGGADFHGTETTHLVTHGGRLYAGQGSVGNPSPKIVVNGSSLSIGPNWTGAQILVKDSPTAAWTIDHPFPGHLRVEAMEELTFTTRGTEQRATPDKVLVAAMSDITAVGAAFVSVRTRDDDSPTVWNDSHPANPTGVPAFPTSFGTHRVGSDTAGIHFIFAGISNGEIHRGVYSKTDPGTANMVWQTVTPELSGGDAITGFAEANGLLYAASALKQVSGQLEGGLFVRNDSSIPATWQRVHRWTPPVPINSAPLTRRALTGLTSVLDPRGSNRDVLIGALSWPGVIVRIDPDNNHELTVELDVRDFFARRWNDDSVRTADVTIGYTKFTAANDPLTGQPVHLIGLWIEHPDSPKRPHNGSHYLIRHQNGTYEAADIEGLAPAVSNGESLRATRAIAATPFGGESNRVFYFGGYDAAAEKPRDSAWIVKSR